MAVLEADRDGRRVYVSAYAEGIRPDALVTVSEWADEHRILSQTASAEPGRYRTERTPYLREIMDALSASSPVSDVVVMKGAQLGFTEAGANWIGYVIDHAPGPMLVVWPRDDDVKFNSRVRVDPMIQASPRLRRKVRPRTAREGGNTIDAKEFPGGVLRMTGAQSAAGLRSMPARYLFLDEVDGYPLDVEGEGDPILLAERRTSTFPRAKRLKVSTPTVHGASRIERLFEDSDQRIYCVPCPECGHRQPIRWPCLRWEENDPDTVRLACEGCGVLIPEREKQRMLAAGEWVPQNPGHPVRGYHLSALYAPFGMFSWSTAVRAFLAASHEGNQEQLKAWVNTVLGETWKVKGEAPNWRRLYERREDYEQRTVPTGAVVLTAGVDVQNDRLEVEVVGWGPRNESWSIDHRILLGDTAGDPVWRELAALLDEPFRHREAEADLRIARMAVDAGHRTTEVYRFVRGQGGGAGRAIAVRGRDELAGALVGTPRAVERSMRGRSLHPGSGSVLVWPINTSAFKAELYGWLRQEAPLEGEETPAGWAHWPKSYGEEYFRQLTAEQLVPRRIRRAGTVYGRTTSTWEKTRDRNEALDLRIYARAAAHSLGLDRWDAERWDRESAALGSARVRPPPGPEPERPRPKRRGRTTEGDDWGGRWRGL